MFLTYLLLQSAVVGDYPDWDTQLPVAEGIHILAALGADRAQMRDYTQPVLVVAPGLSIIWRGDSI